jgi:hypothetical protein
MIDQLREQVTVMRQHHYSAQRYWSFLHYATTFGAAILSLIVATIAPLRDWQFAWISKDALIAGLSLVAAILATLAARGGFERKWIANRLTRSKLDLLALDLLDEKSNVGEIKDTLKRIIAEHDAAIVGAASMDDAKLSNQAMQRTADRAQ